MFAYNVPNNVILRQNKKYSQPLFFKMFDLGLFPTYYNVQRGILFACYCMEVLVLLHVIRDIRLYLSCFLI